MVNGQRKEVGVDGNTPLLWVLRENLIDWNQIRLRHRILRRVHRAYLPQDHRAIQRAAREG
jgi:hypothetical protein